MENNRENNQAEQAIDLAALLFRQREGETLTAAEQTRLEEWLQLPESEGVFNELLDRKRTIEQITTLEEYDAQGAVRDIFDRLGLPLPSTGKRAGMHIRRVAVAAALLLVIAAVWLLTRRPATPAHVVEAPKLAQDIQPGGNKAILTLGNGARVVLDSSQSGTIAQQGMTSVVKLSDGQVAYRPAAQQSKDTVVYNTLATPRGGVYQLTLPDGSRVWLNAASSVTYPTAFTGNQRLVSITGEVYVEVAHNAHQPFLVQAGNQLIQDVGTAFDIDAYADEPAVVTTLIQGRASVAVKEGRTAISDAPVLSAGEQAKSTGKALQISAGADIAQVLAWKNGSFSFQHADLPTVMRQLSRWYAIDVVYEGAVPTGTFDGEIGRGLSLNQVLQGLAQTRIHYTIEGTHKIVIRP